MNADERIPDPDSSQRFTCPTCHGSGTLPDFDNTRAPCPTCNEDGYIDRETALLFGLDPNDLSAW